MGPAVTPSTSSATKNSDATGCCCGTNCSFAATEVVAVVIRVAVSAGAPRHSSYIAGRGGCCCSLFISQQRLQ